MVNKTAAFRVGHVRVYLRGRIWYLSYFEQGVRRQPRVGPDRTYARQMAAEINGQLEASLPSALGFQTIAIGELRQQWLDHHEHVRRSSVPTVRRYRAATQHLIEFLSSPKSPGRVADFRSQHAEAFVRYLRDKQVAPNGHAKARKRNLRESGIKFILETCSSLFNFAARRRHLPPYADNPFRVIEVHRMPIEDARPVVPFTRDHECRFLEACDAWQFPVFLTLLCTGLRPGELMHLLLPDDLDLGRGWLHVRNKPLLGWQVKTRTQRDIPLIPVLRHALEDLVGDRQTGPVFLQRRYLADSHVPPLIRHTPIELEHELAGHPDAKDIKLLRGGKRKSKIDVAVFASEARELWQAGWSQIRLASRFGCSAPVIARALAYAYKQAGERMPTRIEQHHADVQRARQLHDGGTALCEIAKNMKISSATARKYLNDSFAAENRIAPDLRRRTAS